jgi:hypothetical protein
MPSKPRTPKSTVKIRRLPKVGDTIMIPVKVTRVAGEDEDAQVTVRIPGNAQLSTTKAKWLLEDE